MSANIIIPEPVTPEPEPQALETRPTACEMRVVEVSEALAPAYARASTLELTDAEIAALTAPFPDAAIDIRPHDGLIYIAHINISDRLNEVLHPGQWALVCRRHWLEAGIIYGEYVLLIRGCYVGESVGGHPHQPNNPKTNYSDALESTAAEALRRIAGKRLSCGSQVWHRDYAAKWIEANAVQKNGKWYKRDRRSPASAEPAQQQEPPPPQQQEPQSNGLSLLDWINTGPTVDAVNARIKELFRLPKLTKDAIEAILCQRGWYFDEQAGLFMAPKHPF